MLRFSRMRAVLFSFLGLYYFQSYAGWWDPRFDLAGANGGITSLVSFHGKLYVVGGFTRIAGVNVPGAAQWDGRNWVALEPTVNATLGAAIAIDQAVYFVAYARNTNQVAGLVQWDGQTWTALGTPAGYRDLLGHAMVVNGSDFYCEAFPEPTGDWASLNKAVVKWNGNRWSVLAITSHIGGGGIYDLAFAQGGIYGSGALQDASNPSQGLNLGRLAAPDWLPVGGGIGSGLSVFDIASDGTNLLIQGGFTSAGGNPAEGFAVWTGADWVAPPAATRNGRRVTALTSNPGEVLASEEVTTNGSFGQQLVEQHLVQYHGTNRTVVARGDASMKLMRRTADGVYCTGGFRAVGGIPTGNLALWSGSTWAQVGEGVFYGLSDEARATAVGGTNVYAAGEFHYAGQAAANHIARWDGQQWHPLGSGVDGTVGQMATRADELYVVGAFTSVGGIAAINVAKWNGTEWSNLGDGLSGQLSAIAASDTYIWVARKVSATNFVISRWDGLAWSDVASGVFGYGHINTMLASDTSLIIGGSFMRINGIDLHNIARWEDGQWHPLGEGVTGERAWIPNDYPFMEVRAMVQDGTNLYVGGSFTNAGHVPAMNVARWDGAEWSALGEGLPGFGSCLFGSCIYPVTSLAVVQGQLFAGGGFTTDQTGERKHGFLARWDGAVWTNVVSGNWSIDNGTPNYYNEELHVWGLAASSNELYVAGKFGVIGSVPSYNFAIWHAGRSPNVNMVTPSNGQIFRQGTNILLGANAPDDGQVVGVEFFANGSKVGDAQGPLATPLGAWLLSWTNPPADIYSVTARATDNDGNVATSPAVQITVRAEPSPPLIRDFQRDGSSLRFRFTGQPMYDYTVEFAETPKSTNWATLAQYRVKLQATEIGVTNSVNSAQRRFFRIRRDFCFCRNE